MVSGSIKGLYIYSSKFTNCDKDFALSIPFLRLQ